jgi:F-type H+-transporting ATPase subunit epsilon
MQIEIITPDKTLYKGTVDVATFPGSKGSFQVLKNHAALISSLERGKIVVEAKNRKEEIMVNGGIVEVMNNNIIVLAEEAVDES